MLSQQQTKQNNTSTRSKLARQKGQNYLKYLAAVTPSRIQFAIDIGSVASRAGLSEVGALSLRKKPTLVLSTAGPIYPVHCSCEPSPDTTKKLEPLPPR